MAYPRDCMLLQWGGSLAGGEIFSGTMRFADDSPVDQQDVGGVDNDDSLDDLISDLTTFWQSPAAQIPSDAVIHFAKWNRVGTDGHYKSDTTRLHDGLNIPGSRDASTPRYPTQVALVTSWGTAHQRGLASKGRTYWPTAAPLSEGDRRLAPATQTGMAGAAADLIAAWGNWNGIDITGVVPVIGSKGSGSRPGIFHAIDHVAVGARLDILRTRGNQVTEKLYQSRLVNP